MKGMRCNVHADDWCNRNTKICRSGIEIGKEISELIMLAGYVYLLVFIVQLIEVLMTSLRTIFML